MYFFVDESGNTGANLFDSDQPILYYGVLSSTFDIDDHAAESVRDFRALLGVERIHANELGMGRLLKISEGLLFLQEKLNLRFDFYTVYKLDHALLSFFDQVFDQGLNPAVPWTAYWTPLRYVLLWKIAVLFDVETLHKAWDARIQRNDERAIREFIDVCQILLERVNVIPDKRSRQIISDALTWASRNPQELQYNTTSKKETYWITPNLIGFQSVMHGIATRIKDGNTKAPVIVVDQQSQFNATQRSLAELYAEIREFRFDMGTGLPEIDFTGMPDVPILFRSGSDSVGLELVDVYLWLFKRLYENKRIAIELRPLLEQQISNSMYNEISLDAIAGRWMKWFDNLPEPTPEQWEFGKKFIETDEQRRLAVAGIRKDMGQS